MEASSSVVATAGKSCLSGGGGTARVGLASGSHSAFPQLRESPGGAGRHCGSDATSPRLQRFSKKPWALGKLRRLFHPSNDKGITTQISNSSADSSYMQLNHRLPIIRWPSSDWRPKLASFLFLFLDPTNTRVYLIGVRLFLIKKRKKKKTGKFETKKKRNSFLRKGFLRVGIAGRQFKIGNFLSGRNNSCQLYIMWKQKSNFLRMRRLGYISWWPYYLWFKTRIFQLLFEILNSRVLFRTAQ
jgi:hypothetical protein